MVLYELLTGTTPLDGEQLRSAAYGEMQRLIREETPPKPSTRVSTISRGEPVRYTTGRSALQGDLDWIVMKALEKERDRRYETANALAQDLERHLRDEPVSAGPPSTGYRLKKFVRRNRRSLLSGVAAAVALLIGLAVAGGVWLNATVQESERLTLVEGKASTLISQIEQLMEQNAAADYDDGSHFRQVLNLVAQLENLVGLDAPEMAEQLFRRAQRENPESFWANCTLGNTLGDLPDSSNTSSGPAYGMDGMPAQYWELNGGSERGLKFDERIGFLRTAVAIRPDAAGAWSSLGNSLRNGGRLEEAAASLQRAIKLNPNMASVHSDLGKFDKAIASYRKAIELDPKFAMAHNNLGLALVLGSKARPGK